MKYKIKGGTLVTVLIYLMILTMLAMVGIEISQLNSRMTHQQRFRIEDFTAAETALNKIESQLNNGLLKKCISNDLDNQNHKTINKCYSQHRSYHIQFTIQLIAQLPCVQFPRLPNQKEDTIQAANFYRINLLSIPLNSLRKRQLQSTYVLPKDTQGACQQQVASLSYGRQSWREIE